MITKIEVSGYRLLQDFHADLGQLNVVIGANATGKSTLIDFLQLVTDCMFVPVNTAIKYHGGLNSMANASRGAKALRWLLEFKKPRSNLAWAGVPLKEGLTYAYEVSLAGDPYGQAIPEFEILRNRDPYPNYASPLKFLEMTPDRSFLFDSKQGRLVPFDSAVPNQPNSGQQQPGSSPEQPSGDLPGSSRQEQMLRLGQMRFYNDYPVPTWTRTLFTNFAFYPGFDVGRASKLRTEAAEIRPDTAVDRDGSNLGTFLHEMLTRYEYRSFADNLREILRTAYPWFADILAETSYGTPPKVLVRLREQGVRRSYEVWELSDGTLRFLCLLAALLNPRPAPLIAIDEPEVGLHPRLLPILGDVIKTASEQSQILVTTHSPELLDRFSLEDVAVMTREESRAIWDRPDSQQMLREMLESVTGTRLSDLHRSGELEMRA
jgi:predicted ATPase